MFEENYCYLFNCLSLENTKLNFYCFIITEVTVNNVSGLTFIPLQDSWTHWNFSLWEDASILTLGEKNSKVWTFSSVQLLTARQASLSITNSQSPLKLKSIELVMPSSHLILCCPLLLLPSIPPTIRVFSNESTLRMRWPKYWSFSFSISPSNEHPGLISFRMDWLDLLAVQGTLKSFL